MVLIDHLIDKGLLPGPPDCPKCKLPMHLITARGKYIDDCCWICNRVNKKKKRCRIELSVRTNTVFQRSKLSLPELVLKNQNIPILQFI